MSSHPPAQGLDALLAVIEARNRTLRRKAGSPHVKRPHNFVQECFQRQLPPAPSIKNDSSGLWFITVDNPFPPCVRSIDELELASLSDLVMDDHHRGKFLLVRVFKDMGCGRTAAFALVCDQNYDFELLKLPFICINLDVGHRWQLGGQFFAINVPYLTIDERNNETCIRVDHPSDLLDLTYLSESQLTRAGVPGYQIDQSKMSPLQCKEAGNSALKKRDFGESLACYSKGIHCSLVHSTSESSAGEQVCEVDGAAVLDAFKVHDIVKCNSFTLSPINQADVLDYERLVEGSSAIWIRLSYANHSCLPNSQKVSFGDLVLLHATQPIAEGEEITINYSGDFKDFHARQKQMRSNWSFQCDCSLCKTDAQCSSEKLLRRAHLYKETVLQSAANPPMGINLSLLPKFERYVEDINRTYSHDLFAGLPMVHQLYAQNWLLGAFIAAQGRSRSCQATINILLTLGFDVQTDGKSIQRIIFTVNSVLPQEAMTLLNPLVVQAIEARQSGNTAVADHLLNFAKTLERVNYGTDTQTLKACQNHLSQLFGTPENVIVERMAEMGL